MHLFLIVNRGYAFEKNWINKYDFDLITYLAESDYNICIMLSLMHNIAF